MEEILYLTITYTIFVFLFLFEVIFYLYKHIKPENITNKLDWIGFAIRLLQLSLLH